MTTLTLRGNQLGEALQFNSNGTNTVVEIGRVWFQATDTVTLTLAPGAVGPGGAILGGPGMVIGLTVTTADGRVTTFGASPDGLDIDPDQEKNGADFLYVSESPAAGIGGAYAGLQLEKIVVSDVPLTAGALQSFSSIGGYLPATGSATPPQPILIGNAGNNTLVGTANADTMDGRQGNDTMFGRAGSDTMQGGQGNDRMDGGLGNDLMRGGEGNERMLGGAGADRLFGDAGDDVLDGGLGRDILTGGLGGDTFVFGAGDTVRDFNAAQGDQIAFNAALGLDLADIRVATGATGTTITYAGQTMTLAGVTQPFDLGNAIVFDYVPSFDFV